MEISVRFIWGIILIVGFGGCQKEKVTAVNTRPVIEFISINDTVFRAFKDPITITIQVKDGDGDIGHPDPDSFTLFVHDSRLRNPSPYYVPPMSPPGTALSIKSPIQIELKPLFHLTNDPREEIRFEIYLYDRAGNQSNRVYTPAIALIR
jgi:hypothetical protein